MASTETHSKLTIWVDKVDYQDLMNATHHGETTALARAFVKSIVILLRDPSQRGAIATWKAGEGPLVLPPFKKVRQDV